MYKLYKTCKPIMTSDIVFTDVIDSSVYCAVTNYRRDDPLHTDDGKIIMCSVPEEGL